MAFDKTIPFSFFETLMHVSETRGAIDLVVWDMNEDERKRSETFGILRRQVPRCSQYLFSP